MPNDLTTLSGALLEMKDELIYQLGQKGVTATYSSTDGLLGLIGRISDIQTGGGSCYKVTFDNASYTTTGSVTVSVTVLKNYSACVGETVTFTSSTSTTTTATTDSNGVATATISFSGSTTLTASIGGAIDTTIITVQSYLFFDDASADHTSYYDTTHFSNATLSYSTDHYSMTMTSTNITSLFINDLTIPYSAKISVDMKITKNLNTQSGIIVMNNAKTKGIEALYQYGNGSRYSFGTTTSPTSHGSKIASDVNLTSNYFDEWVTLELSIENGTSITYKLIYNDNVILNYTTTITNQLDSTGNLVGLIHSYNNGMITQFKNLKVEAL